jgi:hypothetical protein
LIYRLDHLVDLPWARSVEDLWELGILIQDPFFYSTSLNLVDPHEVMGIFVIGAFYKVERY